MEESRSTGILVCRRCRGTHQCPGDRGSDQSDQPLEQTATGTQSHSDVRQLNNGRLHQSPGWHTIQTTTRADLGVIDSMRSTRDQPQGVTPGRQGQHSGGRSVERDIQTYRMVPTPIFGQSRVRDVRPPTGGPLCHSGERTTSHVLFETVQSTGMEGRRILLSMDGNISVRFSTMGSDRTSTITSEGNEHRDDPGSTMLAQPPLVPPPVELASGPTVPVPNGQPEATQPEERFRLAQRPKQPTSLCVENIRKRLQAEGVSPEIADFAVDARRSSTIRVYDSRLEAFFKWAAAHDVNPLEASIEQLTAFLSHLFAEGKQTRTIKNYKSAIASVHKGFADGSTLGNNQLIIQVLKGMFNRRPPTRKLAPSWSINDVLKVLSSPPYEPMDNAPLELLTHKTLFLVAAASARRRSCLTCPNGEAGFSQIRAGGS